MLSDSWLSLISSARPTPHPHWRQDTARTSPCPSCAKPWTLIRTRSPKTLLAKSYATACASSSTAMHAVWTKCVTLLCDFSVRSRAAAVPNRHGHRGRRLHIGHPETRHELGLCGQDSRVRCADTMIVFVAFGSSDRSVPLRPCTIYAIVGLHTQCGPY